MPLPDPYARMHLYRPNTSLDKFPALKLQPLSLYLAFLWQIFCVTILSKSPTNRMPGGVLNNEKITASLWGCSLVFNLFHLMVHPLPPLEFYIMHLPSFLYSFWKNGPLTYKSAPVLYLKIKISRHVTHLPSISVLKGYYFM